MMPCLAVQEDLRRQVGERVAAALEAKGVVQPRGKPFLRLRVSPVLPKDLVASLSGAGELDLPFNVRVWDAQELGDLREGHVYQVPLACRVPRASCPAT